MGVFFSRPLARPGFAALVMAGFIPAISPGVALGFPRLAFAPLRFPYLTFACLAFACLLTLFNPPAAIAQPANGLAIEWQVANRFRLFSDQRDFDEHVKAMAAAAGRSVLASEQWLETQPQFHNGRGWADTVHPLCYDSFRGQIIAFCERDGRRENYLNPLDARISVIAKLPAGFGDAMCHWVVGTGDTAETRDKKCTEPVDDVHASTRRQTPVAVTAQNQAGAKLDGTINVQVRDVLIVGMGDSIASGEGNPDHPMRLDDQGFCFLRFVFGVSRPFYLPGRANVALDKSCSDSTPDDWAEWRRAGAGWVFSSCHLSLYGYQMRTALALAVENPQISVTYVPMGCTGATIREGLIGSKEARERPRRGTQLGGAYVESQLDQLTSNYLASITANGRRRPVDLLLLTIGANDIGFSGLAADVIVEQNPERALLQKGKVIVDPAAAEKILNGSLRTDFAALRTRLRAIMGGNLSRVVFTSYENPGLFDGGKTCGGTRRGFDVHPAFSADGARLAGTVRFVNDKFFPKLKSYVTCAAGGGCAQPALDAMAFVDSHQAVFGDHGFCASGAKDPAFDRECFRDGDSFNGPGLGLATPLRCTGENGRPVASEFKPYAYRERWVRTANDSYFIAMTYPETLGSPTSIHDATWGLESVVYGGALHPTAEGHAAMADAALVAARNVLGLGAP